jgi:hypothetical protein
MIIRNNRTEKDNHLGNVREQVNKVGDAIDELDVEKPICDTDLSTFNHQV